MTNISLYGKSGQDLYSVSVSPNAKLVLNMPKKCHVLFEWPPNRNIYIYIKKSVIANPCSGIFKPSNWIDLLAIFVVVPAVLVLTVSKVLDLELHWDQCYCWCWTWSWSWCLISCLYHGIILAMNDKNKIPSLENCLCFDSLIEQIYKHLNL